MAVKVTFTLDEATVNRLRLTAERLKKPKSQVVREAIREYHDRSDRLSETERKRMLAALDWYDANVPKRPQEDADRELAEVRAARRLPGRLHPVEWK